MNRTRLIRIMAVAGTALGVGLIPAEASAQLIGPCPSPLMPPPCIVYDGKKFFDVAKSKVNEIQKIQETVKTIQQAKAATQGIVADAREIANFDVDFRLPNADELGGPLLNGLNLDIAGLAGRTSDAMFAGAEANQGAVEEAQNQRLRLSTDANVEAFAYGINQDAETQLTGRRMSELSSKACKSRDLRNDWSVNSEIKMELINARAQQSYLLSSYLRMASANGVRESTTRMPKGYTAGTVASAAATVFAAISQSDKVRQMLDLYAKANTVLTSLGVVQMAGEFTSPLQGVIVDYDATIQRRETADAALTQGAQRWSRETDSGTYGAQQIKARLMNNIDQMERDLAARRALPIEALSNDFAIRKIDVNAMTANDVDPRQFIGNWVDATKAERIRAMVDGLLSTKVRNGGIDGWVDGDNGTSEEVRQLAYNLADVRMEEAWKKVYADEARVQLEQLEATISQENQEQGRTIGKAESTAQLEQIIQQMNALGQEISGSQDIGAKQQAADILAKMQDLVRMGTSLPYVDPNGAGKDTYGNDYPPGDTNLLDANGQPYNTATTAPQNVPQQQQQQVVTGNEEPSVNPRNVPRDNPNVVLD